MARPLKLAPSEVEEVWARWRSGQAVKVLARAMRVNPSTVRDLLHRTGGIRPAPKRRWRSAVPGSAEEYLVVWRQGCRCGDPAGLGSRAVDGEPRGPRQRRSCAVSGGGRGPGGVVTGGAAEGDQAGHLARTGRRSNGVWLLAEPRRGLLRDHHPTGDPARILGQRQRIRRRDPHLHQRLERTLPPIHLDQDRDEILPTQPVESDADA